MTIGEGLQPGCMMKILEAERRLKSANPHEDALLQQQQEEGNTGAPHLGAWKVKGRHECEECEGMATARGVDPFLKADLLTRTPKRHGQSLHRRAPGFSPSDTGAGSHMSYELTRNSKKANRRARSM
jgi:alpha-L-fucosidase